VWYDQVIAINAFVFADCIFVMIRLSKESTLCKKIVENSKVLCVSLNASGPLAGSYVTVCLRC